MTGMFLALLGGKVQIVSDPYFEYTTLLLPGNGTNGAQNNTFLDGSTNNFTITRNGNTTQGTFSPFSQTGWGNYFGTSNNLYLNGEAGFAFGSSADFAIEFFFYANSISADIVFYDGRPTSTQGAYPTIYLNGTTKVVSYVTSSAERITGTTTISVGVWYHVLLSRSGGNTRLFVNGVQQGSTWPDTTNYINPASRPNIAVSGFAANGYIDGYISNFRVLNGTGFTSVTVPTTPFATNTANQVLLTCQANRFVDSNTTVTAKTINRTGSPSVQAFSPFNPTSSWSAVTNGGSGYFDGSGDYLSVADNTALELGSGDFTIESWVYLTALPSSGLGQAFIAKWNASNYSYLAGTYNNSGTMQLAFNYTTNGSTPVVTRVNASITTGNWFHAAYVRSGGSLKIFLNGTEITSSATISGTLYDGTEAVNVCRSGDNSNYVTGYLSGTRIVKGTAVYTTDFTPPTAPLTATQSANTNGNPSAAITGSATSLLLNFTNAGIYDATSKNDLETLDNTVNGVRISTAQYQFGGSSIFFDGTGTDYLWIQADQPIQRFGTAPFTIELWIRLGATGSARGLIGKGTSTTGWLVSLNSSNQVVFTYGTSTITSTGTISANVWTYIAVVREGTGSNQTKIYIGGFNDGTGTVSTDFNQTSSIYIGGNRTGGDLYSGYMQDVRITNGYARTVTTIPTSAFPTL